MKRLIHIFSCHSVLIACLISLGIGITTANASPVTNGWSLEDGTWYYYSSGQRTTGWLNLNNTWYYLTQEGKMVTGWLNDNGTWYYLSESGAMQTGWISYKDNWYYLSSSGAMQTGWVYDNGLWYYMAGNGDMITGWFNDNGTWYYLTDSGAMLTGWLSYKDDWYYLSPSGAMDVEWGYISGKWYFFSPSGAMLTGWQQANQKWYYFYDSGEMAYNTTIDGYVLEISGAWTPSGERTETVAIWVNKQMNCVTIYADNSAIKSMVCSTGPVTPIGTYSIGQKYRWHALIHNSYGQYCSRIVGQILFHSVPYNSTNIYDLQGAEYNKLGTSASAGCIRLSVEDAKWIYDNCPSGTTVTIYNSDNAGALGKPSSITIPDGQTWDPTDPEL